MKKVEEHLQGQAHAPSRQNICSVLKRWYFWKHAIVGHCFYTTLLVIEPYRSVLVSQNTPMLPEPETTTSILFFRPLSSCMLYLNTDLCSLGTAWPWQQQVLFSFSVNVPDRTWFTCFLSDCMGCMGHGCFSKLAVIQWNSGIFILNICDLGKIHVFSQWIWMKLARASAFPSCFYACNYHSI